MKRELLFEDVSIGDALPAWSRRTDLMHWNRYAAVNDEFFQFHMDDDAGRKAGNPNGAFGMGNLRYAYIVNALGDWVGEGGALREVGCQYRAMNQKGDTLTVIGSVVEKLRSGGEALIRLEIDVLNQEGASTCPGYALIALAERDPS